MKNIQVIFVKNTKKLLRSLKCCVTFASAFKRMFLYILERCLSGRKERFAKSSSVETLTQGSNPCLSANFTAVYATVSNIQDNHQFGV